MNKEKDVVKSAPKIKVGISLGDINGTGPELIIKALGDARMTELVTPVIFGNSKVISFYRKDDLAVVCVSRLQNNLIRNVATRKQHIGLTGTVVPVKVVNIGYSKDLHRLIAAPVSAESSAGRSLHSGC